MRYYDTIGCIVKQSAHETVSSLPAWWVTCFVVYIIGSKIITPTHYCVCCCWCLMVLCVVVVAVVIIIIIIKYIENPKCLI